MEEENTYYKNLYDDAYYNRIDDPNYNCVKKYLHKIVKHYYIKIKGVYYEPEINSFKPILECFDKLIKENNFDNIDDNINFMFAVNRYSVQFGSQLYALMSPNNAYKEDSDHYFNVINDFFWFYETTYRNKECRIKSNARMQEILECYMKYAKTLPEEYGVREISAISSRIGAIFYLSNKDIHELNNIYYYLFNNIDSIRESFVLNSSEVDTNYYNGIAEFTMNYRIDKPKIIIK